MTYRNHHDFDRDHRTDVTSLRQRAVLIVGVAAFAAVGLGACAGSSGGTSSPTKIAPPTTVTSTLPTSTAPASSAASNAAPDNGGAAAQQQRLAQLNGLKNQVDGTLGELDGQLSQSTNTTEVDPTN